MWPPTLQAKPQGTQAAAGAAAAAGTAYLPEEQWHRKDLRPNRDQPYSSRDQQYGGRDQQYSSSRPKAKPYPPAGSGYEPYPGYGSGPGGGGGGGPGDQLRPPVFVDEECIRDIDEFAEAFNRGGVNRCAAAVVVH